MLQNAENKTAVLLEAVLTVDRCLDLAALGGGKIVALIVVLVAAAVVGALLLLLLLVIALLPLPLLGLIFLLIQLPPLLPFLEWEE